MKKILLSLTMLFVVVGVTVAGTTALFSDTENTDDNYFQAGTLDLQVDFYHRYYYDTDQYTETSWPAQDITTGERFFELDDVVPGDYGYGYVSLHMDNDAWVQARVEDVQNYENGCTEPEAGDDTTCAGTVGEETTGPGQGELPYNMTWQVWVDDGDGVYEPGDGEVYLYDGPADVLLGSDWGFDLGGMTAGDSYIGYAWSVPVDTNNVIQTDRFSADISFDVEQSRHNPTPSWATP